MRRPALLLLGCLAIAGAGCPKKMMVSPDAGMVCPEGCVNCLDATCHDCSPGQKLCQDNFIVQCKADGTVGPTVSACDPMKNQQCQGGVCLGPCDLAGGSHSYIGCDYWPVTTLTAQLNPYFDFAVAVANPLMVGDVTTNGPAEVTVTMGKDVIATKKIKPGDVETIILPWNIELSQNNLRETSALSSQGAYHLVSSLPVTVYQFSPLQFRKPMTKDCVDQVPMDGNCHSYTNDASILLPSTALFNEYYVMARQTYSLTYLDPKTRTMVTNSTPGFLTVVATQDHTNVTVTSTAHTEAGINLDALAPGDSGKYTLDAGDVIQLVSARATMPCADKSSDPLGSYCDLGPKYDLTGSHVLADKPVAVFGGHSCSFVPYNKWACDHLEQQMFPLATWGKKVLVAQTVPQSAMEPNVWRVMSGSDKNLITFDPATVQKPVTLNKGQWIEFVAQGAFSVDGTGRVMVGQYMVGEQYTGDFNVMVGDPSLGLGVPVEQYRDSYDFLSPDTYTTNTLTVIAPKGANITLDDADLQTGFMPIGASGYGYAYKGLNPGAHHVKGDQKFGIMVSGLANFTSYLFPGGLNLIDIPLQ